MPFKNPPPLYQAWRDMRNRCLNPNFPQWKDYGGRGIKICERWNIYANFAADMGAKPTSRHTLDRKNNDLDYSPENCRWATRAEQQQNTRRVRKIMIEGREYIAAELAKIKGVKTDTVVKRAKEGLPLNVVIAKMRLSGEDRGITHCRNGHEFTIENIRILVDGSRACRECLRANFRRRYHLHGDPRKRQAE